MRLLQEIEAAGFVFDAQSNVSRNRSDDHKSPVFDGRVRGRTDQLVYRFRKPKQGTDLARNLLELAANAIFK
jgi:predicted methyltransferase